MFAVIYQSYIKQGLEDPYKKAWHAVAEYFIQRRGSLGSCLHQTREGLWLAYSRWPDKATRDKSWPGLDAPSSELPELVREAIVIIQNCMDQERNETNQIKYEMHLEVVDDFFS
jgi:hypothetical protein